MKIDHRYKLGFGRTSIVVETTKRPHKVRKAGLKRRVKRKVAERGSSFGRKLITGVRSVIGEGFS